MIMPEKLMATERPASAAKEIRADFCIIGTDPAGVDLALAAAALGAKGVLATAAEGSLPPELVRVRALGVLILAGPARFLDPRRLEAGARIVRARTFVIATGARSAPPAVPGIDAVPLLETAGADQHVLVLGGGPASIERALAARRQGAAVTLVSPGGLLPAFDPEAAGIVAADCARRGIKLHPHVTMVAGVVVRAGAGPASEGWQVSFPGEAGPFTITHRIDDDGLLPALEGLQSEKAGITLKNGQPVLDEALRTTNRRILVVGAATGNPAAPLHRQTQIRAVLGAVLFGKALPIRQDLKTRLCFSTPPIAEAGIGEQDIPPAARRRYRFHRVAFAGTALKAPAGHIKAITTRKGQICGVSLLGERAPELIVSLVQAMAEGRPLQALTALPIAGEGPAGAIGRLAGLALRERLRASWWLGALRMLGLTRVGGR
jgi:pyruvate/2-oxoglutarate dehydrogenase complex dihydrolipoamide dehydrogenase (E3) component